MASVPTIRVPVAAAPERFSAAIRGGARYVRHSPAFRAVLVRTAAFILAASALWGLLGVRLRIGLGFDSLTYGLIVGAFGAGAILTAVVLPKLRRRFNADILTLTSSLLMAALLVALATLTSPTLIGACMLVGGGAWIAQMSGLNVAAQFATASWGSRSRLGHACRGVPRVYVRWHHNLGKCCDVVDNPFGLARRRRRALGQHGPRNPLSPSPNGEDGPHAQHALAAPPARHRPHPKRLPAFVSVEYEVEPSDQAAFMVAMQEVRRMRLRDGASSWGVFHEPETPRILMECFQIPSWTEHMRQHDRITKQDLATEEAVRRFHRGTSPPKVRHYLAPRTD